MAKGKKPAGTVQPSPNSAPQTIRALVDRFSDQIEVYRSGRYNEAQLRQEFLNPFFRALGWDMDNEQGYAEAYKDVIHEDAIRMEGSVKAPDYCFRIGGTRKFFLEAKKPSVDIKNEPSAAYQLRRYAWSAKLPLSILSDFEEFAIYDCRVKPEKNDSAATARIFVCTFRDYNDKWDYLASIFSKDAIQKGSFDKFAESSKSKRGTSEVDAAFLAEIEVWRNDLARNLALRNPSLSQRELNFAVQRIIDRIIFLRICEDRGIEDYGHLLGLTNGAGIYPRLCEVFEAADARYNSGLFHFRKEKGRHEDPDELTLRLDIDDKQLRGILTRLYYPDSPYEFSVLSADILGQVYEQFLGKVIRLTAGHRAVVEDKPEVKKAGGVYYTPTYIVDYIVRQTVGKLVEGKTPKQVDKLRILDPACGSGSFLIGAYQFLLDWHRDWYAQNEPGKHAKGSAPAVRQTGKGGWALTIDARKRILLNNIFGVDIDAQAVEVTKLSLLLKVLEGETGQSLQILFQFLRERALPDIGANIKCGNSLIGSDFYEQQQMALFNEQERLRINVFDWQTEFSQIMTLGGFDAVIGNPPWGALLSEAELAYLRQSNRAIIVRMIDSFMYFVHQGTKRLHARGVLGMILPDVILYQGDNQKLREFILSACRIHRILNMGNVFEKVTRPACILILERQPPSSQLVGVGDLSSLSKADKPAVLVTESSITTVEQQLLTDIPGALFITAHPEHYLIWLKVKSVPHRTLQEQADKDGIQRGVSPDLKEAFLLDRDTARTFRIETQALRKVLTGGKHVKRYHINRQDLLLIYTRRDDDLRKLPGVRAYVDRFRDHITCKEVEQGKHSLYALHRARDENIFLKQEKLLGVVTGDKIVVALDDEQTFATDGLYLFGVSGAAELRYVMGLLNSRLFVFIYRLLALESGRVLAQVKPTVLAQLPIPTLDPLKETDRCRHSRLVELVGQMLALHGEQAAARTPQEQTALSRQIASNDTQIDKLVYDLYGLTEDEIKIVEEATA